MEFSTCGSSAFNNGHTNPRESRNTTSLIDKLTFVATNQLAVQTTKWGRPEPKVAVLIGAAGGEFTKRKGVMALLYERRSECTSPYGFEPLYSGMVNSPPQFHVTDTATLGW